MIRFCLKTPDDIVPKCDLNNKKIVLMVMVFSSLWVQDIPKQPPLLSFEPPLVKTKKGHILASKSK